LILPVADCEDTIIDIDVSYGPSGCRGWGSIDYRVIKVVPSEVLYCIIIQTKSIF